MCLLEQEFFALKQQVYHYCQQVLHKKVQDIKHALDEVIESTRNETKSSAGDKFETGRAMLQIEQDNIRSQLQKALEQKAVLEKININTGPSVITCGSLVETDKGYFFVSVALGKINLEHQTVIAISPQSPLGIRLVGMQTGQSVTVNNTDYTVANIV